MPGEFVLGYRNEYGQLSERPLLDPPQDPDRMLPPDRSGGAATSAATASYLVFRQLRQDVEGFWDYVARRRAAGGRRRGRRELLAARVVGRWPSGAPAGALPRTADDPALADANDFGYHHVDPRGLRCPVGAHIRRDQPARLPAAEPGHGRARCARDPPAPAAAPRPELHRRRRAWACYFLCLNANLARQFEFVQHGWIERPVVQRPGRRRRPAGRLPRRDGPSTFTDAGDAGPPPVPGPAAVRPGARRGLLLPAGPPGAALPRGDPPDEVRNPMPDYHGGTLREQSTFGKVVQFSTSGSGWDRFPTAAGRARAHRASGTRCARATCSAPPKGVRR